MVNMTPNDLVKDIQGKDKLDANLKWLEWIDTFKFDQFDKDVENSFQNFLESNKNQLTAKDTVQTLFNDWLNKNYDRLDKMKDTEIDNQIVQKTTFELQSFSTLIELESFQQILQIEKDQTKTKETITLWDSEVNINFYNWVNSSQVTAEINWKNFKDKEEIVDLLKTWKVKELQKKIWWTKTDNKYENLPRYWDDWKFWDETFTAFKKYINDNNIDGTIVETTVVDDKKVSVQTNPDGTVVKTEVDSDGTVVTTTVDSNGATTSNTIYEYWNTASVWIETYGGKSVYECELNETVNIW